jgi:hypothetical protein
VGLFSAAFRDECRKGVDLPGAPEVFAVLAASFPSGDRLLSDGAVPAGSLGMAEPHISRWGGFKRAVDPRSPTLQSVELSPEMRDIQSPVEARRFAKEVARYRRSLRLSPVTITFISPNIDEADWFPAFSGVLSSIDQVSPLRWALKLRPDDRWLVYGKAPAPTITPADWPNAHPSAWGIFSPMVYGVHDSTAAGDKGMLPTYFADQSGSRYICGLTKWKLIRRVFENGTLVPISDWATAYVLNNGIQWTLVDFTSPRATDAVITVDAEGITEDGEPTGALLTNPALQIQNWLVLVKNGWRSGPFPAVSSAPINPDATDALAIFHDEKSHEGARYIGGKAQVGVLAELENWGSSHETRFYWQNDGRLALGVVDHRRGPYPSVWLRGDQDIRKGAPYRVAYDDKSILRELLLSYVHGETSGRYHQTLRLQDLSVTDTTARGRELAWSAARVL